MVTVREVTNIRAPIDRCFDLARSVEVHLLGNIHWGEAAVAGAGVTSGLIGLGETVTWRARHLGFRHHLTSEITVMERPAFFRDVMVRGVFRSMLHDHFFRAVAPGRTEMTDVFSFAAPVPVLGRVAEITFLRSYMRDLLRERNAVLKTVAESSDWRKYLP